MSKYIILLIVYFSLATILLGTALADGIGDGVNTLIVSSVNNGGTVASEDSSYHLRGSLGLSVQGNTFGKELMIRSGFWFGKGLLTPEAPKSHILFMILPALAGSVSEGG